MDAAAGQKSVSDAAERLFSALSARGLSLACAESCTGGMVTAALTDIPGSSRVLWGGVVAYSNDCKSRLLGVPPETLAKFGAVSREVVRAMAAGALAISGAELSLAITGIAGPEGGSADKPVGLVWFGFRLGEVAAGDGAHREARSFEESAIFMGNRREIRSAAAERALIRATELASGRY